MSYRNPVSATLRGILTQGRSSGTPVALVGSARVDGKTVLITGANSGLGKAAAIELARRGARIIMACRGGIPGAGDDVRAASGSAAVDMVGVDLAEPASIRKLVRTLASRGEVLDVVVCNAGVMPRSSRRAPSGFELMFAVNYLANVLLLGHIFDAGLLRSAGDATPRIVIVSSESHRSAAPVDFATVGAYAEYGAMTGMRQYAHTKLLLCTYAAELARRLDGVAAVHCLCPGPVASNIAREAPAWVKPVLSGVMRLFFKTPEQACAPVVYLASSPDIAARTGVYLHEMTATEPSGAARDPHNGAQLWAANADLVARAEAACS